MAEKKKMHFGRAGEFYAMSEILLRGWNVAVPVVDVGDDVFVIDDNDKTTRRVQVKSSGLQTDEDTSKRWASFNLSRKQLRAELRIPLLYMFMIRDGAKWRFLIVPRQKLDDIHRRYLDPVPKRRGRPPKTHDEAQTDTLVLEVTMKGELPWAWGSSLADYFERWPDELPLVESGPGSVLRA